MPSCGMAMRSKPPVSAPAGLFGHHDAGEALEFLGFAPVRQIRDGIAAEDQDDVFVAFAAEFAEGIDRVCGATATDFTAIGCERWVGIYRKADHFEP